VVHFSEGTAPDTRPLTAAGRPPAVHVFVVDATVRARDFENCKSDVVEAAKALPPGDLVGLIAYDGVVRVYDLSYSDAARAQVLSGADSPSSHQLNSLGESCSLVSEVSSCVLSFSHPSSPSSPSSSFSSATFFFSSPHLFPPSSFLPCSLQFLLSLVLSFVLSLSSYPCSPLPPLIKTFLTRPCRQVSACLNTFTSIVTSLKPPVRGGTRKRAKLRCLGPSVETAVAIAGGSQVRFLNPKP